MESFFNDVKRVPLPFETGQVKGQANLSNLGALNIGHGAQGFRADQSGIWLGAEKFADAPFSVDMAGNLIASSATFGQYISKTGTSQVLSGDFTLNDNNVKVDGVNKRITIGDGSNTLILIGYQLNGFS